MRIIFITHWFISIIHAFSRHIIPKNIQAQPQAIEISTSPIAIKIANPSVRNIIAPARIKPLIINTIPFIMHQIPNKAQPIFSASFHPLIFKIKALYIALMSQSLLENFDLIIFIIFIVLINNNPNLINVKRFEIIYEIID